MSAIIIHLAILASIALWVIRRPFSEIRHVFICWWIGIFFYKIVSLALVAWAAGDTIEGTVLASVIQGLSWVGAVLLFRAAVELILWKRARTKWFKIALGLFVLGQILGAVRLVPSSVVIILCLPLLPAFRWTTALKAVGLLQATLAFLLTLILGVVETNAAPSGTISEAAWRALDVMTPIVVLYSLLGVVVPARRLHLSIRRIRSRLVVSHFLISVIPVGLAGLFLLLSGTLFVSTYRGQITARRLQAAAREAEGRIADSMNSAGEVPLDPFGRTVPGQTMLIEDESGARVLAGATPSMPWEQILEQDVSTADAPLLWNGRSLFIRSRWEGIDTDGNRVRVEALCLLDSLRMAQLSDLLGTPAWVNPAYHVERTSTGITVSEADDSKGTRLEQSPSTQISRPTRGRWRLPGGAVIQALAFDEESGDWSTIGMPVISSAGFGEQISLLFAASEENPLATAVLVILGFIALLLVVTVLVTTGMVSGIIRSIARSVRALTTATHAIGRGDLSHRIVLEAQDELWDVAASFNKMSEDLSRMQAMELERHRLEEDLRLAREIHDRLLPSSAPEVPNLDLAGVSIPAREVGGDYYDFITLPDGKLGLVVADVSGKGTPAAMLMSAFRAALRSQDLTMFGPADILGRVNGFIHSSVDPGRFITAFVAVLDPHSGEMRYANAGHDAPLFLDQNGTTRELSGGGLILGMLPEIVYEDATAALAKGDAVMIYTDGVTEARDADGEFFGIDRLRSGLGNAESSSASEILDQLMNDLMGFRGAAPQSDDITMVLARRV